ncbi:translation initiation factor IF-2-like [Myotis myotis]|uniref:translation initiation factor IF-2-like n=1 Tax=Myotis myotis TaxID=51298 RepID=UPI001748E0CF|nr:translation initiation factor IF-2-like [Myotis myotis]
MRYIGPQRRALLCLMTFSYREAQSSAPSTAPSWPPGAGVQGGGCAGRAAGAARRGPRLGPPGAEWRRQGSAQGGGGTAGPAPSRRPRPGRSGRGLGAGRGWRRLPHLLAGGEARGPGASAQLPAPFSTLAKERNTPRVRLIPFDFSNSRFQAVIKDPGRSPQVRGKSARVQPARGSSEGARREGRREGSCGERRAGPRGTLPAGPGLRPPGFGANWHRSRWRAPGPVGATSVPKPPRPVGRAGGEGELGSRPPPLPSLFQPVGSWARSPSKFANRHRFRPRGCAAFGARGRAPAKLERRPELGRPRFPRGDAAPFPAKCPPPARPGVAASRGPGPGQRPQSRPGARLLARASQPGHLRS